MKALNLYILTRIRESGEFSRLENILSGRNWHKEFSAHEVSSLCALTDRLVPFLEDRDRPAADPCHGWASYFDGFYFSYTIEHISKEFDLLKLSPDAGCVLNIELKSEAIEEERVQKQLEQNRYYLSHISRTILSYTYVMETDTLYCLNDHGFLKKCQMSELASALKRPALQMFVEDNINQYFRAKDYLISPVGSPEKYLTGRYFLTNQQSEFRRQILELLSGRGQGGENHSHSAAGTQKDPDSLLHAAEVPVISLTGYAGTGKTLLLFDLAREFSRRRKVLFLHGGELKEGHRLIDRRLHKVRILSGTDPRVMAGLSGRTMDLSGYRVILVDEANRFSADVLRGLLEKAVFFRIPCIFSYDPHSLLGPIPPMQEAETIIGENETLRLELSGNIRINRPVFSFLRTLFHRKDRPGYVDYSCIDVLYAADRREEKVLTAYYLSRGYELIRTSRESFAAGEIISREFDKVLMVMDRRFYYDDELRLCARGEKEAAITPLYEGLSRARENLCLVIVGNRELYSQILSIRMQ